MQPQFIYYFVLDELTKMRRLKEQSEEKSTNSKHQSKDKDHDEL